ncbi:MAG: outer membrane lipoprotein carrier protein LolA [Acidobacteriota bacterium]
MTRFRLWLRFLLLFPGVLVLVALFPGAKGEEPPAPCEEAFRKVLSATRGAAGLRAGFRHVLRSPALNQSEAEEGTLVLAEGGRTRWEYSRPPGKLAVADGRRSVLYLPAERQAFVRRMDAGDAPVALRLLSGERDLEREVACEGVQRLGRLLVLKLVLRDASSGVRDLEVAADASTGRLSRVFFRDALGNEITLELLDVELLDRVDPSLFAFEPPPGTAVLQGP